ncbi:OTU-like cysteine protease family protein [Trichomonas vaginalis G3]|uniref:Ubiquitin thioesterase OTU n=1 Tax=Trichomonas vaginalis (strain ATCC PRA-98 / G3) TaxID=412133 RepID=A2G0B2_TRIV3|nr:ubiquitin-specific protease activity protein [Trichomonas vaginalis G3]EAX89409.1 OTU-like cysteine protease family protein [Trichomonas vaginalis G3]KAI5494147.1 ubiquitin-specific protease activity protein [Trichomonas vaginalis G3]|eukprot:XP_001302339.1 OTU-like cysteine protease family protein [Trichomonas vaginalis G3]
MPSRQKITYGFPQKEIPTDAASLNKTLEQIGIRSREMLNLTVKELHPTKQIHTTSIYACEKVEIPADNSCLFASISYLCTGSTSHATEDRFHCVSVIKNNPTKYTEATLVSPNKEYCAWLSDMRHWGGYIEMEILSEKYNVEICVLQVENNLIVPINGAQSKKRIYLLYDNIHYDALVFKAHTPPEVRKIVDASDEEATIQAKELMNIARAAGGYTNVKTMTYKCTICNKILNGSKEAHDHSAKTNHMDYVQIQNL